MPFAPDPKTLSLVVGLAHLVFALLATLYIARTSSGSPALATWRWGRVLAGCGFLVNLASSARPDVVPPVLGNLLQMLAGACDIAAYCLLLEQRDWRMPLRALLGVSVVLVLAASLLGGESLRLLAFSAVGAVFYSVLATLVWRASRGDWLLKVIGFFDALLVLVLLVRLGKGWLDGLVRFDGDGLTLLLYLTVYLVVTVNGFGFLLLVKQKDDRQLQAALQDLARVTEARQRFLTQAAHAFRTPVASIKASLDSLRFVDASLPPEVAERLARIGEAGQHLAELAEQLLDERQLADAAATLDRRGESA